MSIQQEIEQTKKNKVALLDLIASKFQSRIDSSTLFAKQPELATEVARYGQLSYDIAYINIEIALNNMKIK